MSDTRDERRNAIELLSLESWADVSEYEAREAMKDCLRGHIFGHAVAAPTLGDALTALRDAMPTADPQPVTDLLTALFERNERAERMAEAARRVLWAGDALVMLAPGSVGMLAELAEAVRAWGKP